MAYIGKTPTIGNFQVCDAISVVNGQAAYTMQVGGVNVSPESANHMLVSLNGILQAPTSSFTVSGSTITFASALETGDVIDFIQILGNVLDLGVPSDNTVTTAKIVDGAVTSAKLDSGVALGKVLQVVQGNSSTAFTQASASNSVTYYPSSNKLTASITPSSTSSKIIINAISTVRVDKDATTGDCGIALVVKEIISGGSTTELYPNSNAYNSGMYTGANAASQVIRFRHHEIIYRTPSTTSAITYEVGVFGYGSALSTVYLNNDGSRGEIILTEVAG